MRTINELIPGCSDPEIKEVLQAYLMKKQFDAGVQFAKRRIEQLGQDAIDKCVAYLQQKLEEDYFGQTEGDL
jgi:hypothetical protein